MNTTRDNVHPDHLRLRRIQEMERAGCELTTTVMPNGACLVHVREATGRTFQVTHRSRFDFDGAYQLWLDRQAWYRERLKQRNTAA